MRFLVLFVIASIMSGAITFAEPINMEAKLKAQETLNGLNPNDFYKYQKPKYIKEEKSKQYIKIDSILNVKSDEFKLQNNITDMDELPENFRTPGEFEESQAVLISWPSYAFDSEGRLVEPYRPGISIYWYQDENGQWFYEFSDVAGYLLDLEEESPYATLWLQLADAIQQSAEVWIRVSAPEDTSALKDFAASKGYELWNYEFLHDEDGENAFWARDFGPFGIYTGDMDSLMFLIAEYYPNRPIDDLFPVKLAQMKGYKYHKSQLEMEGGNFMTDGHGAGFIGDVIYNNNSDNAGTSPEPKAPMNSTQVNNELSRIFNLDKRILMTSLRCDGGTGHIDIYSKMANDEEILITKYPDNFNRFQFPDYGTVSSNKEIILALNTHYGKKFRFLEVPLPSDDDGTFNRNSCNLFSSDARGYINGLTVNNTFIVPTYSDDVSGNQAGDQAALEIIRKHMPGYKIVPIDSRALTPLGGAIHCITMQIPAENPVHISHSQLKGAIFKDDILDSESKILIHGTVRNHSGFSNGTLYYRCSGNDEWFNVPTEINSSGTGSTSDFDFAAYIDFNSLSCSYEDDIEYYLSFNTNNGKTANRPLTAPEGFYTFSVSMNTSVNDGSIGSNELFVYPNPASEVAYVILPESHSEILIEVFDMLGNKMFIGSAVSSDGYATIDAANMNSGIYICKITFNGKSEILKLIINK
ncbi:MAG: agmatine deiminase family protein [Candidatus Kapaibacterium sp.]